MTEYEKMVSGQIYDCSDSDLLSVQIQCYEKLDEFNTTKLNDFSKRSQLLRDMFAEVGDDCCIMPPLYSNWGGRHVHFGKGVYANFGLTLVDDAHIYVGDYTMFGPNVTVATASHPVLPILREKQYEYNLPIHIGRCCWIGAGSVILPGVSIGDNTVIGAGSVVTKDIPADVVAVGNPCRVMREINDNDKEFYHKQMKIPEEIRQKFHL